MSHARRRVRKIDVLLISEDYPPTVGGGVAAHVQDLALALAELRGRRRRVRYPCHVDVLARTKETKSRRANLRIHEMTRKPAQDFFRCVELWTGASVTEGESHPWPRHWDVIHVHDTYSALIGMLLKVALTDPIQPKLFYSIHRLPRGVKSAARRDPKEAYVRLAREFPLVDKFIVPSQACARALTDPDVYDYPQERVKVVPHGIPLRRLRSNGGSRSLVACLGIEKADTVIFCPARLDENKGIRNLLNAAERLLAQGPKRKLRFVVAGAGGGDKEDASYTRDCQNHAAITQHPGTFSFGTRDRDFSRDEMIEMYRRAQVCVLPSVWDNFPVALLEAGAFGVPVVATNVGGIVEIIDDDKTGLLSSAKTEDLARAIGAAVTGRAEARCRARAALERIRSQFTAERMARDYLVLYRDVARLEGIKVADLKK